MNEIAKELVGRCGLDNHVRSAYAVLSINLLDILPQMKFSTVELFPYVSKNDRHVINGNSNDLYFVKEGTLIISLFHHFSTQNYFQYKC